MLGLEQNLELTEQSRGRLEVDLRQLSRDRSDILDQLNGVIREKNGLAEEVVKLRRDVDKHAGCAVQLAKDKETLMKDNAELSVHVNAAKQESHHLHEVT